MRSPEGSLTLVVMAVVWFLLAAILASAVSFAIQAALHFSLLRVYFGLGSPFSLTEFVLILAPVTQFFLLIACLRRGLRVGDGNLREGLAWFAVRRRLDVVLLSLAGALLAAGHVALVVRVPAYRAFFEHSQTSLPMPDTSGLGVGAYAAWVGLVVVVGAPVTEELFFRGWLWVGLSRWWGVEFVGPATGLLWLLAHVSDGGWRRVLALVPAMVLVTVARAVGGSVRASIPVHMANNLVLSAVLVAGRLASG
jgi:membrane protease YdiL (CAAX protease family)